MTNHGEILRFTVDGHSLYPLFQFDVGARRIFPALAAVIAARPQGWSDYRLLHWLTTPHLDIGCTPAQAVPSDGNAVLAAFGREIELPCHG